MDRETLIERLMAENEEFRHLRDEHQQHDRELEELKGTAPLSASQQWRVSELKKLGAAKPMLITLPFVLLLVDYWPLRRRDAARPGRPFRWGGCYWKRWHCSSSRRRSAW